MVGRCVSDRQSGFAIQAVLGSMPRLLLMHRGNVFMTRTTPRMSMDMIVVTKWVLLVRYLMMARTKVKDSQIDGELVYAYAKTERLGEMEEFISGTNTANIQSVGDRLYDEKFYKAAKILYASIPNNGRLASCHVQLGEYTQAVEAAKKANNPKTWQEVNLACVKVQRLQGSTSSPGAEEVEFEVHPDHLEEVIAQYEKQGCFDALMQLLETGLGNER
ncbi:CHC1, partial [Symbiodinium necroappetens]